MKTTGFLSVGNGEKCPFCNKILDDRIEKGMIQRHLFSKHKNEILNKLFPK